MTTLIFPSSHSAAYGYYQQAMMNGEEVVCASSLAYDDTAYLYKTWFRLPSIYDEDFLKEFHKLLSHYKIEKIYCPSTQVYQFLQQLEFRGDHYISRMLIGKSPAIAQAEYYKDLIKRADKSLEFIDSICNSGLNKLEVAALLKKMASIYGESHLSKLLAVVAIFSDTPKGNIVEIGTLLGKTALLMDRVAGWKKIGKVLCVDSWCSSPQKDSPQPIQDIANQWDWETTFQAFLINATEQCSKGFGYSDNSSIDAHESYKGNISILHIDANHDYDQVKQDYDLWRPHVLPGGWLILDDYVWSHGDGPKRVGDAALENENIERAFTCGGALFMKFAEA